MYIHIISNKIYIFMISQKFIPILHLNAQSLIKIFKQFNFHAIKKDINAILLYFINYL
jgi:hypothetical protein